MRVKRKKDANYDTNGIILEVLEQRKCGDKVKKKSEKINGLTPFLPPLCVFFTLHIMLENI